jgi:hypothetical protein
VTAGGDKRCRSGVEECEGGDATEDARNAKQGGVGRDIADWVDRIGGFVCAVLLVSAHKADGLGRRTKYE